MKPLIIFLSVLALVLGGVGYVVWASHGTTTTEDYKETANVALVSTAKGGLQLNVTPVSKTGVGISRDIANEILSNAILPGRILLSYRKIIRHRRNGKVASVYYSATGWEPLAKTR